MELHSNTSLTFYIIHWAVSAVAVLITSKIISGFQVSGFFSALIAAIFIEFANYLLWPVLIFLTLPLNILTLGLFTFVVNGIVLKIASIFVPGFEIKGFLAAIFGSLFLSIVGTVLHFFAI
ncbi:MAG: phage holin family protein [Pseudobdellovibrio sp.]